MSAIGRRIIVIIVGLALALPAGTFAVAGGGGPSPGSNGLGDSYFPLAGNGGYDVDHYDLDIRYKPQVDILIGRTTITATATQGLTSFNLDLEGLRVRSVTVDGAAATWDRQQVQELVVTPASTIANGAGFEVVVDYRGVPKSPLSYGAPAGAVRTRDGVLILGEPDVAAYWYPSNDHPRDKATFTIDLTVPAGLKAISNGRFTGRTEAAGRVTWSWEESNPMATYLAMAAIGRFRIHRYDTNDGIPVFDAIDPRVHNAARRALAREERVIRFLQRQFGPYPFDALGGVVDDVSIGYALETQTRPIYDPSSFNGGPNVGLIVHELAHQWFGNSVSLDDWRHMWLNEGFATYAEWLWTDARGGDTPQQQLAGWCGIPAGDSFWNVTPGDPGKNKLFAFQVYERGAMTLQALRRTVGTATFFDILEMWLADHAGATGSTAQFVQLSETVSGQELSAFFDEWLFTAGKPTPCEGP